MLRFLCLKVLEDWIVLWWNKLNAKKQIEIKQSILNLLDHANMETLSLPLKTKLAKVIVDIVKRQFPQQWPTFLNDIIQRWSTHEDTPLCEVCNNLIVSYTL